MKNYLALLVLTLACTLVVGCNSLASVAKQLKNDPAFVTVEVKTLYGSGIMVRDGRPNNGNVIGADGTVTSSVSSNTNFHPPAPSITQEQLQALVESRARALAAQMATNNAGR